jgi:hypothetical protein
VVGNPEDAHTSTLAECHPADLLRLPGTGAAERVS